MPEVLPYATPAAQPSSDDLLHLKTLAIIHDVFGGLIAATAALGILAAEVPLMRLCFALMAAVGLAISVSGFCIHTRRLRPFSVLIAAILSPMFPLGTMLGISTIFVLLRPSVNELYSVRSQNLT